MATIRHRESRFGWLRVLSVAVLLLGFGLTADAAHWSHGGRSGGTSFGHHHGGSAAWSMGSRDRGSGDFSAFHRDMEGLRGDSSGSSLHMHGLHGFGRLNHRPLAIGPLHESRSRVASPLIRGDNFPGVLGGLDSPAFPGVIDGSRVGRFNFDRHRDHVIRFNHDRFFDFGGFDHFRDRYRFRRDDFARFHSYGFYRFRCPTVVPYETFLFPDTFLFGSWFGSDVYWWSGTVMPSAGVTVVLIF